MTILDQIITDKKIEILKRKTLFDIESLKQMPLFDKDVISSRAVLSSKGSSGIIAEFKRKSPSKGFINETADALDVCLGYQKAGVSLVSVLTDEKYFGGTLDDISAVRDFLQIPILRKDFIVDAYQIYESKAYGADLILLIAAALSAEQVEELAKLAKSLGLEVLLEVHSAEELRSHVCQYIDLVGVNNRDLKTFTTDTSLSRALINIIPKEFLAVSESGLDDPEVIKELKIVGFKAFLIGEFFMKAQNPAQECLDFIRVLNED